MTEPDEFDAFYRGTRDALLLQTYALTGDLPASSSAARSAYVVAWHHWQKVSRLPDPEAWIRERAWRVAQRRHTARLWHRDRKLDPEARATFTALGKLSLTQRKLLLLNLLVGDDLATMAREVALPRHRAEEMLQTAAAMFAVQRDVPTTSLRPLFEPLRERCQGYRWPRSTIIRRSGASRRRTHTLIGMVGALALLVGSGAVVTDAAGSRPTLRGGSASPPHHARHQPDEPQAPTPPAFSADALLTAAIVGGFVPGRDWTERRTVDNLHERALRLPCQRMAYADDGTIGALARTFRSRGKGRTAATAGQLLELARTPRAARRAYDETVDWYAGCTERRVQLLSTRRVDHVGDEAMQFVLRDWGSGRSYVAGVTRSGPVVSTTTVDLSDPGPAALTSAARLMAAAVNGVCGPLEGTCAGKPASTEAPPLAVGDSPALLLELDLPPVQGVDRPWVATEPRQALDNVAATSCDRTSFQGDQVSHAVSRTYLVPDAGLPDQFGLTETVGAMPIPAGRAFVAGIRKRMGTCEDRDPGTEVTALGTPALEGADLSAWRVTSELDNQRSVTFLMGVARVGTAVVQLGFVPTGRTSFAPGDFPALLRRAAERLDELPGPR